MNTDQSPPCHLRPWSDAAPNSKPACTSGIFHSRRPPPPVPPRPAPPGAKNVLFIVVDGRKRIPACILLPCHTEVSLIHQ